MNWPKVQPGISRWKSPAFNSAWLNAVSESAQYYHENVKLGGGKNPQSSQQKPIKVRNKTGGDLLRGAVVQLGAELLTNLDPRNLWFEGDTYSDGQVAIVQSAVLDEEIVAVKVSGETTALVNVTSTSHGYAQPTASATVLSSTATATDIRILSPLSTTGEQEVAVLMGSGGGGGGTDHSHEYLLVTSNLTAATFNDGATPKTKTNGTGKGYLFAYNGSNENYELQADSNISVRAVDSDVANDTTSLNLTWPTLEAGDVAILITCGHEASAGQRAQNPGGFTLERGAASTSADDHYMQIWSKQLDGTETGTLTITFDAADQHGAMLLIITDANDYGNEAQTIGTTTTEESPSVTITKAGSLVIRAGIAESTDAGDAWVANGTGTVQTPEIRSTKTTDPAWMLRVTVQVAASTGAAGTEDWEHDEAINVLLTCFVTPDYRVDIENPSAESLTLPAGKAIFGEALYKDGRYILGPRDCIGSVVDYTDP